MSKFKILLAVILFVTTMLGGCPKDLSVAVLNKIDGKFKDYNYLDIWISGDYSIEHWKSRLNSEQAEITKIRKWAEGVNDQCVRSAYIDWLDYYQSDLNSAWRELLTKETKSVKMRMKRSRRELKILFVTSRCRNRQDEHSSKYSF